MSFRPGQSGAVVRKGRRWVGRFYEDVPGSTERKRTSVTLGSALAMTKSEAKRKLRSLLEEIGINDDKHLERIINSRTLRQEAGWWRENKLSLYKPSVQETMGSHLDKYLVPKLGDDPLEQITERRVQEVIAELCHAEYVVPNGKRTRRRLCPKSVRNIVGVLRLVLAANGVGTGRSCFPKFRDANSDISPRMKCGESSQPRKASGACCLPHWLPRDCAQVRRSVSMSKTSIWRPAPSRFDAQCGTAKRSLQRRSRAIGS